MDYVCMAISFLLKYGLFAFCAYGLLYECLYKDIIVDVFKIRFKIEKG